jgi:hypothetical protein
MTEVSSIPNVVFSSSDAVVSPMRWGVMGNTAYKQEEAPPFVQLDVHRHLSELQNLHVRLVVKSWEVSKTAPKAASLTQRVLLQSYLI